MKNIIFAMGLALIPGQIYAAGAPAALDALKTSAGVAALPEFSSEIKSRLNPSATLTWDYSQIVLDHTGSWLFDFKDRKYSVKLDFRQGTYDPYVKTFKARPILSLNDFTDFDADGFVLASSFVYLDELNGDGVQMSYIDEANDITLVRYATLLEVRNCHGDATECEIIAEMFMPEFLAAWGAAAQDFAVTIGARKIYMVPQDFNDYGDYKSGYVVTEKSPLYYTTGQPQDFVELFKKDIDNNLQFRPKAYSLALGLTFELTGSAAPYTWTVREMLDSEVQDAINESLANRGRGAAPSPTPGLKKISAASPVIKAGK